MSFSLILGIWKHLPILIQLQLMRLDMEPQAAHGLVADAAYEEAELIHIIRELQIIRVIPAISPIRMLLCIKHRSFHGLFTVLRHSSGHPGHFFPI